MNLFSILLILTIFSVLVGYLVSRLGVFKKKRWFRILSYSLFIFLMIFPCVLVLDYSNQDVGNSGFISEILGFWFYVGTRIIDDIPRKESVQKWKNGLGVFMIIVGSLTLILNLINTQSVTQFVFYVGLSQMVFGYFLKKKVALNI